MFCYKCLAEALEEEQKRHDELELLKKEKHGVAIASHSTPAAAIVYPAVSADFPVFLAEAPAVAGDAKKQKNDS